MRKFLEHAALFVLVFILTCALCATAQSPVGIYGYDLGTLPDGGIVRKVRVDALGRLVVSGGSSTDAGVFIAVPFCSATQDRNNAVGTTPLALPVLTGRWMTRICVSPRNSGTPIVTCMTDGTTIPDAGLNGVGESLEVGDCATYYTGSAVTCISDTASTSVSSHDCR